MLLNEKSYNIKGFKMYRRSLNTRKGSSNPSVGGSNPSWDAMRKENGKGKLIALAILVGQRLFFRVKIYYLPFLVGSRII
ncbi:hypothetical protein Tph_c24090 [Thermacetogenium phaeum DSM 12270]|uniref:Uncharacterized protein n=1 Tax=Thermacetogenium phaeum (strain ATCC BAA-254 / DSM 26808 / PB) TaxID=1089553 RepID=K4LHV6_THEPS|nr:hypothetical protein Tph_c24090 [Thermacetogenium phaeum DSM 12270]